MRDLVMCVVGVLLVYEGFGLGVYVVGCLLWFLDQFDVDGEVGGQYFVQFCVYVFDDYVGDWVGG